MSTTSTGGPSAPRVRPVSWVILAGVVLAISAVLGAWQGSASRLGAVPVVTVASDTGHTDVPAFTARDLDGNQLAANPAPVVTARDDQTLAIRLPADLRRTSMAITVERGTATERLKVAAGSEPIVRIPVTTPTGRLTHVAMNAAPVVYDASGGESLLVGEWAFEVRGAARG